MILVLFPRKLLKTRKRSTVYTVSTNGFSLRKSGLLRCNGSSLKWSRSLQNDSQKVNVELNSKMHMHVLLIDHFICPCGLAVVLHLLYSFCTTIKTFFEKILLNVTDVTFRCYWTLFYNNVAIELSCWCLLTSIHYIYYILTLHYLMHFRTANIILVRATVLHFIQLVYIETFTAGSYTGGFWNW
jgi:hypothetical protein